MSLHIHIEEDSRLAEDNFVAAAVAAELVVEAAAQAAEFVVAVRAQVRVELPLQLPKSRSSTTSQPFP